MTSNSRSNAEGFTLLEVLIALAVMIIIVFVTTRALRQTFSYRDLLQQQGEFYNGIRLGTGILERDIDLMYSPTMLIDHKIAINDPAVNPATNPTLNPQTGAPIVTPAGVDLSRATDYWGPALDSNGLRPSRFTGLADRMSFITSSHVRVYRDKPESEFVKVKYRLEPDTAENAPPGSRVLLRTTDTNVFEMEERTDRDSAKHQITYPVIRGLQSFKLRYYRRDLDQWSDKWDSVDEAEKRNTYPDVIELTMEVAGPLRLQFTGAYYFKRELPLHGLDPSF